MSSLPVDLKNTQGDVLFGFPKKAERFYFFEIKQDVKAFRAGLHELLPLITTSEDVKSGRQQISQHRQVHSHPLSIAFTNIAFSSRGLKKLGLNAAEAKDDGFTNGMLPDAKSLGDAGKVSSDGKTFDPSWTPEFKRGNIDGVLLIAGDSQQSVDQALSKALSALRHTVSEVINMFGHVRPGKEEGHEHFGFEDGLSNPAVDGITKDLSQQGPVDQGIILIGRNGDSVTGRPSWALDGSFLAFRYLQQLVPEFNHFLTVNAPHVDDPSVNTAELLGARLTGRWKSGAPIQVTPLKDDPKLAADPARNNVFTFDPKSQERCPFAAHVRKMNPRGDFDGVVPDPKAAINTHRVIRRGMQYGPEVTEHEKAQNKTEKDRGLLFVCYQSNLANGFQFLQKTWANNVDFPIQKSQQPGFDPLIGQVQDADNIGVRTMTGADPANTAASLDLGMQTWVVTKGGEYFFSPSMSVLKDTLAKKFANGVSKGVSNGVTNGVPNGISNGISNGVSNGASNGVTNEL